MRKVQTVLLFFCIVVFIASCTKNYIPKPSAMLRLEYPSPKYSEVNTLLPFVFERNLLSDNTEKVKSSNNGKSLGLEIAYPTLKGTIYLTYKKIEDNNLNLFLQDAQNITQTHTVKADEIIENRYADSTNRVFGMFYEVGGNAASQSQFYITDSINHFVTGALYFYAKPNYDSILPAADYLKKDIQRIMETIRWKAE